MEPLLLTPSTDDGSFEYLQLHLSQTEWSPTHSATAFLVVALRYIRGSRKHHQRRRRMYAFCSSISHTEKRWCKEMVVRQNRGMLSFVAFMSIFISCSTDKKKRGRINMHEGLKQADEGRVRTPGLSRCMLIKHSSARWLSPVWQQPSGGIFNLHSAGISHGCCLSQL